MARFDIISKDESVVRYSGKPRYNGAYLKPSYLEFSEIASPTPIAWEVGDYVDYPRTGMRYRLYSVPQASKNARKGSHGRAFTYTSVQFFAATKELEIALFKDIVATDNGIHFSTNPDVSTFENVEGIARRIQACMDYFFPNRWEIRIADFDAVADAEVLEKINTAKDFVLSGGTCLDALSRIYELWQDIGWIHTHENGKEVIIIGYPNKRIDANTSDAYLYGKGRGLTALRKTQTNKEEFATRLYVYGSERNLPSRFYNSKDIHNAESVDIRNLMLPLNMWGQTDGKPDASKAYLENAEAVAKYGLIPKTHYFDSEDAGADIYPTISGMTIGKIREALTALGQTDSDYFPSAELYPDASQRVDKVRWCDNPDDHGDVGDVLLNGNTSMFDGETKSVDVSSGTRTANIVENKLMASAEFSYSESRTCKARFSTAVSGYVNDDGFESVVVKMRLSDSNNVNSSMSKAVEYPAVLNGGKWEFALPSVEYDYGQIPKAIFGAYVFLTIAVTLPSGSKDKSISYVLNTGIQHLDLYLIMEKTFLLRLHEIGFDIDKQASLGKGKVISMKTGACAGRSFVIESCRHKGGIYTQGYWDLTLKRQKDNTLKLMFPNVNAQIAEGDEFVLTDIAMPDIYVESAMLRLLSEGQKLIARASSIQNLYEPSIDAKVMVEQGRTLREGMFMEISDADVVDNTTDYILIDTLSIHEDESSIPTYKVTLKERRKVTYKGTPSATTADDTESVEMEQTSADVNVDLTPYAKTEDVNSAISEVSGDIDDLSSLLSSMWHLDENGNLVTDKQVLIKNNLIIDGDTSSGGEGKDTPSGGISGVKVNGVTYYDDNGDGVIDLGTISGGTADLSNYYTKAQSDARYLSLSGGILYNGYSDTPLYIKGDSAGAYIGFMKSTGEFIGYYGFTETTPMVWCGVTESYSLIHSGNIGSQWVDVANSLTNRVIPSNLTTIGPKTINWFDWAHSTGHGIGSYSYGVWTGSPDVSYGFGLGVEAFSDELYFKLMKGASVGPWRRVITTSDDGYVYGLGGRIDIQYNDEINRYGGTLHLQYRGANSPGNGTGGTLTGDITLCANGGNVRICTVSSSAFNYTVEVNGGIMCNRPIFGYMYGTNNNAAAFIFDKPGVNYTGIGSNNTSDTIRFGACDINGSWVDGYAQNWMFYGDVKADKYRLNENNNSFIGTQLGYLSLNSAGNEICIGANGFNDIHINSRPSADGTAPKTYYWRAGTATSWSDHYVGTLLAMHQVETYGLYLRDADTAYTQLNMFGLYVWDNVVQFTRRDLNNVYQKALLELNLNNDNAYIYGNLIVAGDVASA